jgi:pimeloyl-ACP methyl ester carboxylesterase
MTGQVRYAQSGDTSIAYRVTGEGTLDVVLVPGAFTHLEHMQLEPRAVRFSQRLASFARLITFDKRGTGLSDRAVAIPTLEQRMDDVRAVMDAVGSERAALIGVSEGGPMSMLFAATYPERTIALVLYGTFARGSWAEDYPWARRDEEREAYLTAMRNAWGTGMSIERYVPSLAGDSAFRQWWAALERTAVSPGAAVALARMNAEIDARHVLDAIRVPTLVVHRTGDRVARVEHGRYIAERVPGAKYVELPGEDHVPIAGDMDRMLDEIEEFLTGVRHRADHDRVLATVLFTDVVRATERAVALGDRRWRELLERHHSMVRRELGAFRGREIDTAGDGFLAAFDGPARAIRAARTITDKVKLMGLDVRAGLHTGECEVVGDKLAGIAVHIGARVAALAGPGEVLVSSTVKDLVAGSGLEFEDRGTHTLKGVPGEWRLYAVDRNAIAAA